MTISGIVWRVLATWLLFMALGWANSFLNGAEMLTQGAVAGHQFDASNVSYLVSKGVRENLRDLHVPGILCIILLVGLWWAPVKKFLAIGAAAALVFVVLASPQPASAYYSQTDYTESYYVLPNETAFWVPDVGDNKTNQAKMDSEDYYKANKVASKLFNIPHVKLPGSGTWSNYYVPAGRLILVERTPVARHWIDATDRGTSVKKEGMKCQSKEGLDVTMGMSIGVNISPDNAPKYLYNFGITPLQGSHTDPNVIFTSVLFARSLESVTDNVLKTRIHGLLCNEMAQRTLDEVNLHLSDIMKKVTADAEAFAESVGVTIEFMGSADTLTFSPKVQDAIDQTYQLTKLRNVLDVQAKLAANETMTKWNGAVPSHVSGFGILPQSWIDGIASWFSRSSPVPDKK